MQEYFKNIRDVDKKIRLLEFYVFGNVTVFREIKDDLDREKLQEDIYSMNEWSERWLLRFHPDKC